MADPNAIGYETLGSDINKRPTDGTQETTEGVASPKLSELTIQMTNEQILKLTKKWKKEWTESDTKQKWEKQCEDNQKYWEGVQFETLKSSKNRPNVDNVIFEAVETYIPSITRRNPEPIVELGPKEDEKNPVNQEYVAKLKKDLAYLADRNKLRLKLQRSGRSWMLNMLGIAKFGWDLDKNIPIVRIIRPKKIILDPTAWTDEDGYTGNRIGEYRKMTADKIIALAKDNPDSAEGIKQIEDDVKNDLATEINFIEWWTNEYMVWEYKEKILLKTKNPHWNYDKTIDAPADLNSPDAVTSEATAVDEFGEVTAAPKEVPGINFFETPQMPYRFLAMFTLGDQPMDNTSLIGQNLANQDRINKRNKQIDKNADNMNEGLVVSLERAGLTESQAKNVSNALRKGGVIAIPSGNPQEAIYRPTVTGLPADVFNDRNDLRERVRDIFGTRGSSAAGIQDEKTVRGKIISKGLDTDRTGGGISQVLEQHADDIYNFFVQLLYVYDPSYQFAQGTPPKVLISVKEGSLLPKDSTTIANQAIELGNSGKMALVDMYKRLEYPNAEELAVNVWLETNAPQVLYANDPRVAQVMQMQADAAAAAEQAKAEGDMQEKMTDHAHEIEKEKVKASAKGKPTSSSVLAEVPQDTA